MCKGIFSPQILWEMGESWDLINTGKLIRRLIAPTPRLIHLLLTVWLSFFTEEFSSFTDTSLTDKLLHRRACSFTDRLSKRACINTNLKDQGSISCSDEFSIIWSGFFLIRLLIKQMEIKVFLVIVFVKAGRIKLCSCFMIINTKTIYPVVALFYCSNIGLYARWYFVSKLQLISFVYCSMDLEPVGHI